MTKNEAIDRLKDWGGYIGIISGIEEDIRELRLLMEYNRSLKGLNFEDTPKRAGIKKPTEAAALKNIAVIEKEIEAAGEKMIRVKEIKEEIDAFVETLDRTEQRLVQLRYIKKKTWQCISLKTYISIRQCYRIHNKILAELMARFG